MGVLNQTLQQWMEQGKAVRHERTQALYWFHLSYSPQWQMLNLKALETIVQFSYLTFFHFLLRHTK